MDLRETAVLERAIKTYGSSNQRGKCLEEIGEFMQALNKYYESGCGDDLYRVQIAKRHLQEEIADCIIMFEQMAMIYGYQEVQDMIEFKICRLQQRLLDNVKL